MKTLVPTKLHDCVTILKHSCWKVNNINTVNWWDVQPLGFPTYYITTTTIRGKKEKQKGTFFYTQILLITAGELIKLNSNLIGIISKWI